MNGYELTIKLRRIRRKYPLTATEQALYHELGAICNEDEWPDVFSCSNQELCNALQLTEKTLIAARLALIQAGLLFYKSGQSRRQFGSYSFEKAFEKKETTLKIPVDMGTDTPVDMGGDWGVNTTVDVTAHTPDYIKLKTQTETKPKVNDASASPPKSFKKFSEDDFKEDIRAGNTELNLPPKMLHEFFRYWSERSASSLMKFQLEKTWETKRRLETWRDNQAKFERNGNKHSGTAQGPSTGRAFVRDQL